ncbi:hypothetical protein XH84_13705 [Bradyrhizobium nanningense]|nr:hypothetical protein XH84_13705 [Bradyrhizobium nanningense]
MSAGSISLADILPFIEEKLSIGLWRSNESGQMQWSPGFYEVFGLDPRQTEPSPAEIDRRIHPEDGGRVRRFGQRSIAHATLEGEFRIIRHNGTLRRICARAEPLPDPTASRNGCLALLPMSRKSKTCPRLSTLQRSARELWRGSFGGWYGTASCDGHISAFSDPDPCVEYGNPGKWADLLHDKECEPVLREWQVSLATGQPSEVEARLRQANGAYRCHQCTAVPLGNSNGGVSEWLGLWIDAH